MEWGPELMQHNVKVTNYDGRACSDYFRGSSVYISKFMKKVVFILCRDIISTMNRNLRR